MNAVSTSGPRTLAQRRMVVATSGFRCAYSLDGLLGLDDVALEPGTRRVRASHLLGEEGGVVLLGAVVVRGALEHDLAHRRVAPGAGGEDVHRPDHVVLVGEARGRHQRVDDQAGVDDRVDLRGPDDPLQQRVLVRDLHVLGPLELAGRRLAVHADDRVDVLEALERLREPSRPSRWTGR